MEITQYLFLTYSTVFILVVVFSLLTNTILLKFSTNLGVRNDNEPLIRWSSVSKPALGGITFYISFLVTSACYSIFFDPTDVFKDLGTLGVLATTSLAFLMGLADDAYNTKPFLKFAIQLICGGILIATDSYITIFDHEWLNYILTILWIVGIMNSINMLDNMDGITTIVSIFILLSIGMYMLFHNAIDHFDFMAIIGVIASLSAFLFHNWHPSKMFMGDTGSQFLGMFLAVMSIKYLWNSESIHGEVFHSEQIISVLIVFILPIIDTTSVVINRIARKQSPFVGGKDHTTHHLSYLGLSDGRVGYIFSVISFISLIFSIIIFKFIDVWNYLYVAIFGGYFLLVFFILFSITQKNKDKR